MLDILMRQFLPDFDPQTFKDQLRAAAQMVVEIHTLTVDTNMRVKRIESKLGIESPSTAEPPSLPLIDEVTQDDNRNK